MNLYKKAEINKSQYNWNICVDSLKLIIVLLAIAVSSPSHSSSLDHEDSQLPKSIRIWTSSFNSIPKEIIEVLENSKKHRQTILFIVGTAHEEPFTFLSDDSLKKTVEELVNDDRLRLWSEATSEDTKKHDSDIKGLGKYMDQRVNDFINKNFFTAWEHPFYALASDIYDILYNGDLFSDDALKKTARCTEELQTLVDTKEIVGETIKHRIPRVLNTFKGLMTEVKGGHMIMTQQEFDELQPDLFKSFHKSIIDSRFDFHPWLGNRLTSAINAASLGTVFVLSVGNDHLKAKEEFDLISHIKPNITITVIIWGKGDEYHVHNLNSFSSLNYRNIYEILFGRVLMSPQNHV